MKILSLLLLSMASTAPAWALTTPTNLIVNGDFSMSHPGTTVSGNPAIPDAWQGIQTQTRNAQVLDGAMMFSTAHPTTNVGWYKDTISQTFQVAAEGLFTLTFDYRLERAQNGKASNGAKVYLDQFYASAPGVTPEVVPNLVFQQTYGDELVEFAGNNPGLDQWHRGQMVSLSLTAGTHVLFLSSGTGDFINQYGARVWFDNVALVSVSAVPEPAAALLLGLGLPVLAWARRRPVAQGRSAAPSCTMPAARRDR